MAINSRQFQVLKAIIESFITHAEPVGSQFLIETHYFTVSPATMRNEMLYLEKLGLIEQPHTSAGRVPTDEGLRIFVKELMDEVAPTQATKLQALRKIEQLHQTNAEMRVYSAVSLLAKSIKNVAFATLPWRKDIYYLGLANVLKEPEFSDPALACTIVEVFEEKKPLLQLVEKLLLDSSPRVFIGEENIIPEIRSCALMACKYQMEHDTMASGANNATNGAIGILGPKRMDYAYNLCALNAVKQDLEKTYV